MPPTPVLYVIDSLDVAGTERQLCLTLEHLDRDEIDPAVVALFRRGHYADVIEGLGIPVAFAEGTPGRYRGNTAKVANAAGRHRAAIIHGMLFESEIAGQLAAKKLGSFGITHLVNEYGSPHRAREPESRSRLKATAAGVIERFAHRHRRARFIAVADVVARSGARFFRVPPETIPVVRRGFDFDALRAGAVAGLEAPAWSEWANPKLLAVGRLTPQKGHRYLVDALPAVLQRFPKAQVLIAGDGPLREELATAASTGGVEDHLVLAGVRHDVPALLKAADMFVFPSLWEGAAGALAEALGMAAPVVVSDIPAHRELVHEAACFVTPRNAAALAEGLSRAIDDIDNRRAAAAGSAQVTRSEHDIEANTRLMEKAYREFLLDVNRPSR